MKTESHSLLAVFVSHSKLLGRQIRPEEQGGNHFLRYERGRVLTVTREEKEARQRATVTWVAEILQLLLLQGKQIPPDYLLCPKYISGAAKIPNHSTSG